jgi:hypothetical protein
MQRLILTALMLCVLAACQTETVRENDPPIIDESKCTTRQIESSTCGAN